jgi:hypothetical protein
MFLVEFAITQQPYQTNGAGCRHCEIIEPCDFVANTFHNTVVILFYDTVINTTGQTAEIDSNSKHPQ